MKTIVALIVALFVFQSCSITKEIKVPHYTNDSTKTKQLITHQPIPMPGDTTKNIIVYNVVEQEDDKKLRITDETIRLLIADFFGTITTVITVWQMQGQP